MYVGTAAAVTAVGVLITQIYFTIAGRRYFLTQGRLVYVPELDGVTPREVDGFTLTAWSGAFRSTCCGSSRSSFSWVRSLQSSLRGVVERPRGIHRVSRSVGRGSARRGPRGQPAPRPQHPLPDLPPAPAHDRGLESACARGGESVSDGEARRRVVSGAVAMRPFVAAALVLGPLVIPASPIGVSSGRSSNATNSNCWTSTPNCANSPRGARSTCCSAPRARGELLVLRAARQSERHQTPRRSGPETDGDRPPRGRSCRRRAAPGDGQLRRVRQRDLIAEPPRRASARRR